MLIEESEEGMADVGFHALAKWSMKRRCGQYCLLKLFLCFSICMVFNNKHVLYFRKFIASLFISFLNVTNIYSELFHIFVLNFFKYSSSTFSNIHPQLFQIFILNFFKYSSATFSNIHSKLSQIFIPTIYKYPFSTSLEYSW